MFAFSKSELKPCLTSQRLNPYFFTVYSIYSVQIEKKNIGEVMLEGANEKMSTADILDEVE